MNTITQNCFRTVRGTLLSGLRLGFGLTLIYSAAFAFYAIVRSSWHIVASLPVAEGLVGTLVANAFAAFQLYRKDCVVVDFGTALTFTTLTGEGDILGVSIAPGLKTAIKSLFLNTAQLPEVPLVLPARWTPTATYARG